MDAPHEILEVAVGADDEDVERAYRERMKETHPDQGGSVEQFKRVREAYERLHDGEYDPPTEIAEPTAEAPEGPDDDTVSVTYLNYEVLADHGWALGEENLFEKAAEAGLDPADYGTVRVPRDEALLAATEGCGFSWPYACRGGACANCAVAVAEGDLSTPVNHVLPADIVDRGIRLSCVGEPTSDELEVVFNVKHMPDLEDLLLPPRPFTGSD